MVFDRLYGMRENPKLWAFSGARKTGGVQLNIPGACSKDQLLVAECSWSYGSVENMLWEGVGAAARAVRSFFGSPLHLTLFLHANSVSSYGSDLLSREKSGQQQKAWPCRRWLGRCDGEAQARRRDDLADHRRVVLGERHGTHTHSCTRPHPADIQPDHAG